VNSGEETAAEAPVAARVAPPAPAPAPKPAPAPATAAPTAAVPVDEGVGKRPVMLESARGGHADDLKMIKGVGPRLEKLLHRLGFFHFDQIANWTPDEVAWVDEHLEGFKGRVSRDNWVAQAKILSGGGETEFSRRVEEGEVYE
jgi:predicted flap endonuclease-1-like 5' DNA nuclease